MLDNFLNKINILQIVFFSFILRFLSLIFYKNQNLPDTSTYERIGEEIFSGKIIQTPLHMPGYGIWMYILNFITQHILHMKNDKLDNKHRREYLKSDQNDQFFINKYCYYSLELY